MARRVLRPVGHSLLIEGHDLLLFCGIALHVKLIGFSPCLTTPRAACLPRLATFHASGVPCFTTLVASVVPRLTTRLPTGLLFLTLLHTVLHIVLHTGRWLSGRCWSGGCRSGWLRLSLSI